MSDAPDEIVKAELAGPLQPPLSIGHLLLWIFGSAVVLWSYRWLAEPTGDGVQQVLAPLEQLIRSTTMGGGVAAILVFARRLATGGAPLARQPGHWLLLIQGCYWPAYWLVMCWLYGLRGAELVQPRDWAFFQRYVAAMALYYLWGTALYLAAIVGMREARRWRMFFVTSAVFTALHALLWCCVMSTPALGSIQTPFVLVRLAATLSFLVLCVLRDREERIHRDWMHAAGIGLYVLGSLWYLGLYLAYLFLPEEF